MEKGVATNITKKYVKELFAQKKNTDADILLPVNSKINVNFKSWEFVHLNITSKLI